MKRIVDSCKICMYSKWFDGTLYCMHRTHIPDCPIRLEEMISFAQRCHYYWISELDRILSDKDFPKRKKR